MTRDLITEALGRLEPRCEWYDNPADFRAGLRCLAAELEALLGTPEAETAPEPEKVRAS